MKKILLLLIMLMFSTPVLGLELDLKSSNIIMYNLNDNKIIYSKNEHQIVKVASLTKMMTTIVALENITDLNKEVIMTNEAFKDLEDYSVAGFRVNQVVTYNDLLYGVMLPSGADAAQQLAISVSNNIDSFVKLMNKKAQDLGMKDTNFSNVIGKDLNNFSTAYDMSLLLNYCIENETFYKIFTTKSYSANNMSFDSTIKMYSDIFNLDTSYIIGSKTGFTEEAGVCLASIAEINNIKYMLITLNADYSDKTNHIKDAIDLYNYFSSNYSYRVIGNKNDVIKNVKVKNSFTKDYNIILNQDIISYLKNDVNLNEIKVVYKGINLITKDTKYKSKLGTVYYYLNDEVIQTTNVYLNEEFNFYNLKLIIIISLTVLLLFLLSIKKLLKNS